MQAARLRSDLSFVRVSNKSSFTLDSKYLVANTPAKTIFPRLLSAIRASVLRCMVLFKNAFHSIQAPMTKFAIELIGTLDVINSRLGEDSKICVTCIPQQTI